MLQNLGIKKFVAGIHILHKDMQNVVTLTGYRKTLCDLGQSRHMALEIMAVVVRVLGHHDGQQHLDVEARHLGVQRRDLSFD